ncbi:MAG: hypothetical protein KME64_31795 [Scytonematopsis contorta HA4267-MV1]|jgi:hypothetical protein|nr:hypothetical protein [Scytonematopsis contorta HA4267-MV1]
MKVTIRDSQVLRNVRPEELQGHLQKTGWHETGRIYNDAGAVWRLKKNSKNSSVEYEILLPLQQSLVDYAARISDAIKTLEEVENRSQIDILSELITYYPSFIVKGIVTKVEASCDIGKQSGKITFLCTILDNLREVQAELTEQDYILAIKAYQERLPITCAGELIKNNDSFSLKNSRDFQIKAI